MIVTNDVGYRFLQQWYGAFNLEIEIILADFL